MATKFLTSVKSWFLRLFGLQSVKSAIVETPPDEPIKSVIHPTFDHNGHQQFEIDGKKVWALNEKNARRKVNGKRI